MTEWPRAVAVIWGASYRVVPKAYAEAHRIFEQLADPADLAALIEIEAMTDPDVRLAAGNLSLVPREGWLSGPGSGPIMAAFTHVRPEGARFNDASFGVYYCGHSLETAIAESSFHRVRFLSRTREPALNLPMMAYRARLSGEFADIRGEQSQRPMLYDPESYLASQAFAHGIRQRGDSGVIYDSVRHRGGECAAVFRPRALSHCRPDTELLFIWDGQRIDVFRKMDAP